MIPLEIRRSSWRCGPAGIGAMSSSERNRFVGEEQRRVTTRLPDLNPPTAKFQTAANPAFGGPTPRAKRAVMRKQRAAISHERATVRRCDDFSKWRHAVAKGTAQVCAIDHMSHRKFPAGRLRAWRSHRYRVLQLQAIAVVGDQIARMRLGNFCTSPQPKDHSRS
jgi:hypothetical protein